MFNDYLTPIFIDTILRDNFFLHVGDPTGYKSLRNDAEYEEYNRSRREKYEEEDRKTRLILTTLEFIFIGLIGLLIINL